MFLHIDFSREESLTQFKVVCSNFVSGRQTVKPQESLKHFESRRNNRCPSIPILKSRQKSRQVFRQFRQFLKISKVFSALREELQMEMSQNYDWTRHNSVQHKNASLGYSIGRLRNDGTAEYWKRDEQRGNSWISSIDDCSQFDLPTASGFARSLKNCDVVSRATGEVVDLSSQSKQPATAPTEVSSWNVEFQDLYNARRLRNPGRGVCLHIATQKASGWFIGLDTSRQMILVAPVTFARTFSTREAAEHFAKTAFSDKPFALELGHVEIRTTLPSGEDLP